MKYYNLYEIPSGKSRKDKKFIKSDVSKKVLETFEMLLRQKNNGSRYIYTEVNEVEL